MDFKFSPKVQELRERLLAFMDAHVYPNEALFAQQVNAGDRWEPAEILDELKALALGCLRVLRGEETVKTYPQTVEGGPASCNEVEEE